MAAFILTGHAFATLAPQPPIGVPTMGEWGLAGFTAALGAAGLYSIFKRK